MWIVCAMGRGIHFFGRLTMSICHISFTPKCMYFVQRICVFIPHMNIILLPDSISWWKGKKVPQIFLHAQTCSWVMSHDQKIRTMPFLYSISSILKTTNQESCSKTVYFDWDALALKKFGNDILAWDEIYIAIFFKKVGLRFNDKSNYTQNISHIFLTQQKIYSTLHNAMDRIETK